MAAACVSGAVLSSLFHEHLNSSGDQEGFLLGQIVSHVKDTITDSQISGCKVETITNVYSFIPCPYSATFYDRNGEILRPKLDSLLQGRTKELIGWYKFRRNSTARMSLKERSLHHKLMQLVANGHQEHFLFCLCTSTTTPNTSTHNFDHTVQVYVKGMFKTVPLTVSNLGDSVQSQYKHRNNMTVNHAAGVYSSLVSKFIPEFTDDSGQIHEVNKMNALAEKLQSQLKLLYGVVSDSERQLQSLESELKGIRSRCESKREKERLKQPLPPSPDEPCSNFLPVDMDSAGPPPYSVSDQKPAQESVFVPEADSGEVTMVSPVDQTEIVKDRSREMKKVLEDKKKLVEPLMPIKAGLNSDKAPADTTIKEGENSIEVSFEQMKKSEPDNNKAGDHFSFIDSVLNEAKVSTPSRSSSVRLREKTRTTDNLDGTKLNDQQTSAPSKPQTPLNTSRNEGDSTELNSSLADTNAPSTIDRNDKLRCKPVQRTRTRSLRSKSTEEPDLSLPDTEKSSEKADIASSVATGKGDDPIVLDSDGSVTPLDQTSAVNEQVSKVKSTGAKKKTRTRAQVQAERAAATAAKSLNTPKQSALPTQATGVGDTGFTVENKELINNSDGITNESISTLKEPSTLRGSSSPVF